MPPLPDLPDEIWLKIFTHLELEDRKTIRLTCRRFHEVCNCRFFQENEKIICKPPGTAAKFETTIKKLLKIERKLWNIKLSRLCLDEPTVAFFEKQGSNIHSLVFDRCQFAPAIFKAIIEQCPSLHQISLTTEHEESNQNIFLDFEGLEKSGIVRQGLTDFSLDLSEDYRYTALTNRQVFRFLASFPNIRNLDFSIKISKQVAFSCSLDISSNAQFSFPYLYYNLSEMCHRVEKLSLSYYYRYSLHLPSPPNFEKDAEMKNLKEMSLIYRVDSSKDLIRNPFSLFEHLTYFDCHVTYFDYLSTTSFSIKLLLNSAPQLQSLKLKVWDSFTIDEDCFMALVRSKLVTFMSDFLSCNFLEPLTSLGFPRDLLNAVIRPTYFGDTLLPNFSLKNLNLLNTDPYLLSLFTVYFQRLECLTIPLIHNYILLNIFQYQTQLCSIHLSNRSSRRMSVRYSSLLEWRDGGNLPENRQLEYLTHLELYEDRLNFSFSDFILSEFVFPKLESLCIHVYNKIDGDAVNWKITQKFTRLKHLYINLPGEMSFQDWLCLICVATKLETLEIKNKSKVFLRTKYDQLFKMCSSLREIRHNNRLFTSC